LVSAIPMSPSPIPPNGGNSSFIPMSPSPIHPNGNFARTA
jgi:hypothetical protein